MKILSLAAAGILLLGGCSSEREFGAYDMRTHTWATPHGLKVEDRVSRHLIDPNTAIVRNYLGELYYFENAFDAEMFERDPGCYDYHGFQPNYAGGP